MHVGDFTPTPDGYAGAFRAFGIRESLVLVPAEASDAENAPDYRVRLDDENGPEAGAGWRGVGEKAGDYVSIEIVSPLLGGKPLYLNLFRGDDAGRSFDLVWNPPRREDR